MVITMVKEFYGENTKKNGQETVHIDDIVFYIPKNSDSLEVIVYQNLVKPYFP